MSQDTQQIDLSKRRVVYRIPGMDAVTIRRDVEYRASGDGALAMDLYYPPDAKSGARTPVVVFVAGYPDPGMQKVLGCRFKEMGSSVSWAQLAAASGLVAITYANPEQVPPKAGNCREGRNGSICSAGTSPPGRLHLSPRSTCSGRRESQQPEIPRAEPGQVAPQPPPAIRMALLAWARRGPGVRKPPGTPPAGRGVIALGTALRGR
jgi:hypothetical protein